MIRTIGLSVLLLFAVVLVRPADAVPSGDWGDDSDSGCVTCATSYSCVPTSKGGGVTCYFNKWGCNTWGMCIVSRGGGGVLK